MSTSDSLFYTLPRRVQRAIDDAFDVSVNPNHASIHRAPKRRKLEASFQTGGGGFLVEDSTSAEDDSMAIEDSYTPESTTIGETTQIPFDLIPSALQRLDLPPDDEEVLAVFRNAASGWASSSIEAPQMTDAEGRYVSREDWRAVCAVLLENNEDGGRDSSRSIRMEEADNDEESDEYADEEERSTSESVLELSDELSEDEYVEGRMIPSTRASKTRAKSRRPPNTLALPTKGSLTKRQRQSCLDAYALFFPDVPPSPLEDQKIMIKDVQRVAKLLNEKLKADEVIEMLEMFSTSSDKSMSFSDFSRMMIVAKLA